MESQNNPLSGTFELRGRVLSTFFYIRWTVGTWLSALQAMRSESISPPGIFENTLRRVILSDIKDVILEKEQQKDDSGPYRSTSFYLVGCCLVFLFAVFALPRNGISASFFSWQEELVTESSFHADLPPQNREFRRIFSLSALRLKSKLRPSVPWLPAEYCVFSVISILCFSDSSCLLLSHSAEIIPVEYKFRAATPVRAGPWGLLGEIVGYANPVG